MEQQTSPRKAPKFLSVAILPQLFCNYALFALGLIIFFSFGNSGLAVLLFISAFLVLEVTKNALVNWALKTALVVNVDGQNVFIVSGSLGVLFGAQKRIYNSAVTVMLQPKIVFTDSLQACFSPEEFMAIVSHETGHVKFRHISLGLLFSFSCTLTFVQLFFLVGSLGSFIVALGLSFAPLIISLISSKTMGRMQEMEADWFALQKYPIAFQAALSRFSPQTIVKSSAVNRLKRVIDPHPETNDRSPGKFNPTNLLTFLKFATPLAITSSIIVTMSLFGSSNALQSSLLFTLNIFLLTIFMCLGLGVLGYKILCRLRLEPSLARLSVLTLLVISSAVLSSVCPLFVLLP
jgi:Zn-dependent protease with chaperone function